MSYGTDYADAKELRTRVALGERWQAVAQDLAVTALAPPEAAAAPASPFTRATRLYRASALQRMSQMMFLADDDDRRAILHEAVRLYGAAAEISRDRESIAIESGVGTLAGWLHSAEGPPVGAAIVIGGVEGWAMDFGSLGVALARRGIHALLLDGPGQGQSRLANGVYLDERWKDGYHAAVDFLEARFPGLPIGFVGNSMGGSVATLFAAVEPRIKACVNNGGPTHATRAVHNPSFFKKMMTHCGEVTEARAVEVWAHVEPLTPSVSVRCPYLVVHGGMDPLVSDEDAQQMFGKAASTDKTMVTWSDGIHCIYNHEDDKQALIGDWLASRLER